MGLSFWIAQGLGLIALFLVCLSYNFNTKKLFFFYQILANIFYASSFFALDVIIGGANTVVSILRVGTLFYLEKKSRAPSKTLYICFALAYLVLGLVFFETPLDLLAIVSYEIFNLAMFTKNMNLVRILMVAPNLMIAIYNILSMTYTNAILDFIEISVLCFSIYRFRKREIDKIKYII